MRLLILLLLLLLVPGGGTFAQGRLDRARSLFEKGKAREALRLLRRLDREEAAGADALLLRARVHRALGDLEAVVDLGERCLSVREGDSEALLLVARACLTLAEKGDGSRTQREAWLELALARSDEILRQAPRDPLPALRIHLRALLHLGRRNEALKRARREAEARASDPRYQHLLAQTLLLLGRGGEAVGVLRGAERLAPEEAWLKRERGLLHLQLGQEEEALKAFREALASAHLDEETRRTAGEQIWNLCARRRDWKRADEMVRRWIDAHPKDALAFWWRGYLEELRSRDEEALADHRRAWELSGKTLGEAALHLGHLLADAGREKEAVPLLHHALRLGVRPRQGGWKAEDRLIQLALAHVRAGRWKEAAEVLDSGTKRPATHYTLEQNLGYVLREWGVKEFAKRHKSKAMGLWRRSARHYEAAAGLVLQSQAPAAVRAQILNDTGLMYHYHLKDYRRARKHYERALQEDPNHLDTLENLGDLAIRKKRYSEALEWFDRVLAIDPGRKKSRELKKMVEEWLARKRKRKE